MIGIIANAAKAANTDDDDFFPFDSPDPDPHEYLKPLEQVVGSEVVEDKVWHFTSVYFEYWSAPLEQVYLVEYVPSSLVVHLFNG